MAGSVNKVILVGNLGRDPEIRYNQAGDKIGSFSVATSESWRDKQTGDRRERTEWHRIVVFNEHLNEVLEKFVRKGSKVYLEGELRTRKWTAQDGTEKYTTEVVLPRFRGELKMLDSRKDGPGVAASEEDYGTTKTPNPHGDQGPPPRDDLYGEIPF